MNVPERILVLRDGTRARFRAVVPEDAEAVRRALTQLSPASRQSRFLAPVSSLTEAQLRALVDVDGVNHIAIGVAAPADEPSESPVGLGRIIRYADDPAVADVAITVLDAWQGRGIATALASLLAVHRPQGVTTIRTAVSSSNVAALALAARMGQVQRRPAGPGVYEIDITSLGA